ncbi:MAG: hypothetical protein GY822_03255 [Deltaproteobacteria bacterium]|nr:hypothetical protein [Deltaproteobacteria bacterium]
MGYLPKKLSVNARKRLVGLPWRGNVRELMNTLLRASVWTQVETIRAQEIDDALLPMRSKLDGVLGRALDEDFDVNDVVDEVADHYLQRSLEESHGVKAQAARLIGLKSATTFTNWMDKHGVVDR